MWCVTKHNYIFEFLKWQKWSLKISFFIEYTWGTHYDKFIKVFDESANELLEIFEMICAVEKKFTILTSAIFALYFKWNDGYLQTLKPH